MCPIELIVGLGNPGKRYVDSRHNAGAHLVQTLAQQQKLSWTQETKFSGLLTSAVFDQQPVRLLLPTTFMNLSGTAVAAVIHFYKIPIETILIVHDELDLESGIARLKQGGGHGGHNGLRDIIEKLGNNRSFGRLRIGIGHPGRADHVVAYVLSQPSIREQQQIDDAIDQALGVLPDVINGDWRGGVHKLHSQLP